jgi:large subunit ribosomal protein L25
MDEIQLKAKKRTIIGKQVKVLRREGLIPGIVYGGEGEPIPVELDTFWKSPWMRQSGPLYQLNLLEWHQP